MESITGCHKSYALKVYICALLLDNLMSEFTRSNMTENHKNVQCHMAACAHFWLQTWIINPKRYINSTQKLANVCVMRVSCHLEFQACILHKCSTQHKSSYKLKYPLNDVYLAIYVFAMFCAIIIRLMLKLAVIYILTAHQSLKYGSNIV